MAKKPKKRDALAELLVAAAPKVLTDLILELAEEYDEAVTILTKGRYPTLSWDERDEIPIAKKLEKRYPEKILIYYLSGLGNLTASATRKEYARKAKVMAKVRRLLVEVIGDEPRWKKFAAKIKQDNSRRPAFQQEFARVLPDWQELN